MQFDETWHRNDIQYFGPNTRSICISGPIDYQITTTIISQLLELNARSSDTITLYINTEGGSLTDGFAIYDVIKTLRAPVNTVVQGLCASAGLIIFLAGKQRFSTENSLFFYHEPSLKIDVLNSNTFSQDVQEAYMISRNMLNDLIKATAKITPDQWTKYFKDKTFKYFKSSTALELNIVTDMIKRNY